MSNLPQLKPQKAHGILHEEIWDSPDWIAEEKYDGDRRLSHFFPDVIRFTGTRTSVRDGLFVEKTANVPQLSAKRWKPGGGPARGQHWHPSLAGTVLDGEVMPPPGKEIKGGRSKYVTSIMGSAPAVALEKQREGGFLCYAVFDCLFFKGRDIRGLPLRERYNYRDQALALWQNDYVMRAAWAAGSGKRRFYERIVSGGGEGIVLKHYADLYDSDSHWVKVKKWSTADVVVMGYTDAEPGKYGGLIGAIKFGQYNGKAGALLEVGQCSGITDDLRKLLTRQGKSYKGRVFKLKHWGREPTGAFRHPQFLEWRDDKDPKDCVFDLNES